VVDRVVLVAGDERAVEAACGLPGGVEAAQQRRDELGLAGSRRALDQEQVRGGQRHFQSPALRGRRIVVLEGLADGAAEGLLEGGGRCRGGAWAADAFDEEPQAAHLGVVGLDAVAGAFAALVALAVAAHREEQEADQGRFFEVDVGTGFETEIHSGWLAPSVDDRAAVSESGASAGEELGRELVGDFEVRHRGTTQQ
jgi:hypothetical protein